MTILPLLYPLFIIIAIKFLPFVRLCYYVQQLESNASNGSIEVGTEKVALHLYLFQCLGGICGQQKMLIESKMASIINAGNSARPASSLHPQEDNLIITMLNSLSRGFAIFGDDDNMRDKLQVRVFAYAGVLVILLMLVSSALALISLLFLAISLLSQHNERTTFKKIVAFSREIISCLLLSASLLYPVTTWKQMRSSGSSLGPGYIVMAVLTATMHLGSSVMTGLKTMREYLRRKQHTHRPIDKTSPSNVLQTNMII
jgi:uncharacterized membrane protein